MPPALPPSACRRPRALGLLLAALFLAAALPALADYGPTWDLALGDYPYGERLLEHVRTGDPRFLDLSSNEPAPPAREPHPDFDVGRFAWFQISPLAATLSAASCRVLWTELGLVPAMAAHHLPAALLAALLVGCVTAFAARRWSALAGVVAGGSLALVPGFFGNACHDLKDVAECVFYTLAVLAGLAALETRSARWWLAAGALTALALVQKPNALFLPVQLAAFLALARFLPRAPGAPAPRLEPRGVAWAALAFVLAYYAASPPAWSAPIDAPRRVLAQMLRAGAGVAGERALDTGIEVARLALVTTPPVVLGLAALGALAPRLAPLERGFLLLGALLPIARHFLPGMRHYDGTRHFLEFLPMLCMLAGSGALVAVSALRAVPLPALRPGGVAWRAAPALVAGLALAPAAVAVASTHPNQVTYFNALAGGLDGAQRRGIKGACDYWANSYWQGLAWLSEHAEPGAALMVPLAGHVARCAAPVRLRADLALLDDGEWAEPPFYAMYVRRPGFERELVGALLREPALHEVRVQGAAILRIHRVEPGPGAERVRAAWRAETLGREGRRRILAHLRGTSDLERALAIVDAGLSDGETARRLREFLPPELCELVEPALGPLRRRARADGGAAGPVPAAAGRSDAR